MARYTAQEMREASDTFWVGGVICEVKDKDGRVVKHIKHDAVIAMLRQAADAEDELASVKARLEAVMKECKKWKWADDNWCTSMKDATDTHNRCIDRILRTAADLMEREEREKKYEYAVIAKKHDGEVFLDTEHFSTLEGAMRNAEEGFYDVLRYERREVGEWEEVE